MPEQEDSNMRIRLSLKRELMKRATYGQRLDAVIEKLLAEAEARKGQNHPMPQEESDVDGIEGQQVRIAA